eukprot:11198593-Lingulodinium_polyedra.AAC.1
MEDLSDVWHLPWPEKKDVYGEANLVPVGGPQPDQDELEVKPAPRTEDSVEPVLYHLSRRVSTSRCSRLPPSAPLSI